MLQMDYKKVTKADIKNILVLNDTTITALNNEINKLESKSLSVANLQAKISRGTISHAEVLQIADILGYKLEWIKKS